MSDPTFSGQITGTDQKPLVSGEVSPGSGTSLKPEIDRVVGSIETWHNLGTNGASGPPISTASDFNAAAADLDGPVIESVDLSLRYDVGDRIGAGGMGEVYLGHDRKLNRPVAIKRLKAELARDAKQLQRFVDEARTVAALNHAHIVHVYDYGRDAQGPFLILEFIDGESLSERLKRGPLELEPAVRMMVPICEAVAFAHLHGVIHRDIKPANIMISTTGLPKLGDFGIARQSETSSQTTTGAVLGTFDYMSPEQLRDSTQVDGRSDLWSLACTLYELLTGASPRFFEAETLPEKVREVLVRARRVNPDDRFTSVDEFTHALRSVITENHDVASTQELTEGECPKCHTINPQGRKFCKKQGCGAPLYEDCPACRTRLPVWDVICGECGTDVPATWAARENEVDSLSQQIESHLAEYRFADAEILLTEILALKGPRWTEWRAWAQNYSTTVQKNKKEQESLRDQVLDLAKTGLTLGDYDDLLSSIDQIPKQLRDVDIQLLAETAESRRNELNTLLGELRTMVKEKRHGGLRKAIDRVLELSPGDWRVAKLNQQLREREAKEREAQENSARLLREKEREQKLQSEAKRARFLGSKAGEVLELRVGNIEVPFSWCPLGKFKMGSPPNEKDRSTNESQVDVELTQGFWMARTVVTQNLYEAVMKENPSHFKGDRRPVEQVIWDKAHLFCQKLNSKWKDKNCLPPGWRVDLPTEAQWEYACRARTTTAYSFGNAAADLSAYGWFDINSDGSTHDVGQKRANPWGIYDMHGNIWEWCADWYDKKLKGGRNPTGPATGSIRVHRGGGWFNTAAYCRSAIRDWNAPSYAFIYLGFRLCLSPTEPC